jgi:hypothetical protein
VSQFSKAGSDSFQRDPGYWEHDPKYKFFERLYRPKQQAADLPSSLRKVGTTPGAYDNAVSGAQALVNATREVQINAHPNAGKAWGVVGLMLGAAATVVAFQHSRSAQ